MSAEADVGAVMPTAGGGGAGMTTVVAFGAGWLDDRLCDAGQLVCIVAPCLSAGSS